jgi:hypothetical protein
MFGDPIFILSLLTVFGLIGIWIYQVLQDTLTEQTQSLGNFVFDRLMCLVRPDKSKFL